MDTINKVVLNAPLLKAGDRVNFDYTVKDGPVTVGFVLYVRKDAKNNDKRDNPVTAGDKYSVRVSRVGGEVPWIVSAGEKYSVQVYLCPNSGNAFNEANGKAFCDVSLADGTRLESYGFATANGMRCCCFCYDVEVKASTESNLTTDYIRYVKCTNKGAYVAKLRIRYQKPGSTAWDSKTSDTFSVGNLKKYDLVSELKLPLNTNIQVELVVVGGNNNKSSKVFKVHPDSNLMACFISTGTTLSNSLKFNGLEPIGGNGENGKPVVVPEENEFVIDKVVLNAPRKLKPGDKLSFDYSVKEGQAILDSVFYIREKDYKNIHSKEESPAVECGEQYIAHFFLYQKPGYTFKEVDNNAVCDVTLTDGTKLTSNCFAGGGNGEKKLYHFFFEFEVPFTFTQTPRIKPQIESKLLSRVSLRRSAEGFSRYVRQLDECLAQRLTTKSFEVPDVYNPSDVVYGTGTNSVISETEKKPAVSEIGNTTAVVSGSANTGTTVSGSQNVAVGSNDIRYVRCTNKGLYIAKLRVHFQKPGSTTWESNTSGTFSKGKSKTFDLVSELKLPLNTHVRVELVVSAGKNNKSNIILNVHPESKKTANFKCSGSTGSNSLKLESIQ